jgi:hypothetical protein
MNSKGLFILAWIMAVAAIAYHDMKDCGIFPRSPRIMKAGLVFTMLYLISFFSAEIAGITAGGFVLALFVNKLWTDDCSQQGATGQPSTTAFLTGNPANPNQAAPPPFSAQPPSYGAFTASPTPVSAQQQPPGTTLE